MADKQQTVAEVIEKLSTILDWFESDEVTVESAVKKYEEALKLSKTLEELLKAAENQVTVLKKKFSN